MFDRIKKVFGWGLGVGVTELVPSAAFNETLRGTFDGRLGSQGFEAVKGLKWVRSAKPEIRDVIELYSVKGAAVAARWGVSLDFVPHVAAGRVRWHRTAKSAVLDLVWDPLDFDGVDGWTQSRLVAMSDLERLAGSFAVKVCQRALSDLARVRGVSDLPGLYREWDARPAVRFSRESYPRSLISEAFVLQRLGLPGGSERLREGCSRAELDDSIQDELTALLDACSSAT